MTKKNSKENEKKKSKKKDVKISVKKTIEDYVGREDWRVKENSTVDFNIGGSILHNSGTIVANYWLNEVYDEKIGEAHKKGDMHIHDLSFLGGYCAGWSLRQLIEEGLGGVEGRITSAPAKHLNTLANQMVNFIGTLQNEWAGAQAFSSFDTYLAPFVKKDKLSYKETKQAIQSFVFGLNIPSRWGCVPERAEILTKGGWKGLTDINMGDEIMSYDLQKGEIIKDKIRRLNIYDFDDELIKFENRSITQLLTPEHRVVHHKNNHRLYKGQDKISVTKAGELYKKKTPLNVPIASHKKQKKDYPIKDDLLKLYAWIISEGSFTRNGSDNRVSIYQSKYANKKYCEDIEKIFGNLQIEYYQDKINSGFTDRKCNRYVINRPMSRKIITNIEKGRLPMHILRKCSSRQIRLFIDEYRKGDGAKARFRIYTKDKQIKDDFQELAVMCGLGTNISQKKDTKVYCISFLEKGNGFVSLTKKSKEKYQGKVWCPTTNTSTWICRLDGSVFITGNCQAPFSNITLDWTIPNSMKDKKAIVGGKKQNFTYGDCQKEANMINKAFLEIMLEGDANGRGFQYPIPTYNVTKDFDWESERAEMLFDMTAKYGTPYFQNFINSDLNPNDVKSMCCRLQLDKRELRKRGGGLFGADEFTGSIGVVTLNLPRIAYESNSKEEFFDILAKRMDIAKKSLEKKRQVIEKYNEKGLYPFTKRYLKNYDNHFSTIGLVGMNEMCRNAKWLGEDKGKEITLVDEKGTDFSEEVLNYMRERLKDYQEETGNLYNLEATPAESTCYRLAKHDKKHYPEIKTAGNTNPYYTNSCHSPVDATDDVVEDLNVQNKLQTKFTGGTVFHTFLGEKLPSSQAAKTMVKKIAYNYELPYYTISPTYSICKEHGYIKGKEKACPKCGSETEVYSRITGYYRPIKNWNEGKAEEFKDRKEYSTSANENFNKKYNSKEKTKSEKNEKVEIKANKITKNNSKKMLFTTETCPNCNTIKDFLKEKSDVELSTELENNKNDKAVVVVNAREKIDLAKKYNIRSVPTLVVEEEDNKTNIFQELEDIKKQF